MSSQSPNRRLAVMIDADNAQPHLIRPMLLKAREYGLLIVRRVYGDWTMPSMNGWKEVVTRYGLEIRQQFHYVKGKNHADMAMTIDAMDLLHGGIVDGFCLISSDSDFTPLALRARYQNMFVMGIGRPETSDGFVQACNVFVKTNVFAPPDLRPALPTPVVKPAPKPLVKPAAAKPLVRPKAPPTAREALPDSLKETLYKAFQQLGGVNEKFISLEVLGSRVRQLSPGFTPQKYGFGKFSTLIQSLDSLIELTRHTESQAIKVRWRKSAGAIVSTSEVPPSAPPFNPDSIPWDTLPED